LTLIDSGETVNIILFSEKITCGAFGGAFGGAYAPHLTY